MTLLRPLRKDLEQPESGREPRINDFTGGVLVDADAVVGTCILCGCTLKNKNRRCELRFNGPGQDKPDAALCFMCFCGRNGIPDWLDEIMTSKNVLKMI